MIGGLRSTGRRAAIGSGVAALALVLAGCGCDVAFGDRRGGAAPPPVCGVISTARSEMMEPAGLSFLDLVEDDSPDDDELLIGGVLAISGGADGLGAYRPVVAFLVDRYLAADPKADDRSPPVRTDEVVASARELDAALADGLCPG